MTYILNHGLEVHMIEEPNNFLHYPRNTYLLGSEVFGEYAKYLYELKKKKVTSAKHLLNHLWGKLIRLNEKITYFNSQTDPEFNDSEGWVTVDCIPKNKEMTRFEIRQIKPEQPFEYPLARFKPFFMAKQRLTIVKEVEPIIDHVYYCHTDSIFSDIKIKQSSNRGKLGELQYYGYCPNAWIKNKHCRLGGGEKDKLYFKK